VVGDAGVDKRIDVLATALAGNLTVDDLTELDLAYAPPFGAARDPVVVAGFVAQNQISGAAETITADRLHDLLTKGEDVQLIDVRTREEFAEGFIPGARLIPVDELRNRLNEVDKGRLTVVYCRVGLRGYLACRILTQRGYEATNLSGGITSWRFGKERPRPGRPEVRTVEDASLA
jgi:rhodanese-related sulfurtransferase